MVISERQRTMGLLEAGLLCLPFAIVTLAALAAITSAPLAAIAIALLSLILAWALATERRGRYVALTVSLLLWIVLALGIAGLLGQWLPDWLAYAAACAALLGVSAIGARTGIRWRLAAYARGGRRTREWEWVYTGRAFALSHPLSSIPVGVWLTLAFLVLVFAWDAYVTFSDGADHIPLALHALVLAAAAATILRRHPAAYPLVFVMLIVFGLPLSIPFIVYWADGVRPNLIYRHRFERLLPEGSA